MKKNIFEMGAKWDEEWSADNKKKAICEPKETKEPSSHKLSFAKEKRNGKIVTIVKPFFLGKEEGEALLKKLKRLLATGGTIKEDRLEFQGEIVEKLKEELIKLGFGVKK